MFSKTRKNNIPPAAAHIFESGVDPRKVGLGEPDFYRAVVGKNIISVKPGEDIQSALDIINSKGGGRVFLRIGTHYPKKTLTVYPTTVVEGEDLEGTVIDFENAAYSLSLSGTDIYTDGFVTVVDTATTVSGIGTVWTSSMVGQSIFLFGSWYEIASVESETDLTLTYAYSGDSLGGEEYAIATIGQLNLLSNFTIQNSTDALISANCNRWLKLDNVFCLSGLYGIDANWQEAPTILECLTDGCDYGVRIQNSGSITGFSNIFSWSTVGANIILTNCRSSDFSNFGCVGAVGNGITLTNVDDLSMYSVSVEKNEGSGIELVSSCNSVSVFSGKVSENIYDGIKLTATSDYNVIGPGLTINQNGDGFADRYGVNIADNTSNNNIVLGNIFINNYLNDAGTSNLVRSNIGVDDNIGPSTSPSISRSMSPSRSPSRSPSVSPSISPSPS